MRHPMEHLDPAVRKQVFAILLILTILLMIIMNAIGAPLTTGSAPNGIISFEVAFSPARAQQIILSWNSDAQLRASFIQGLDFLFPLVYSSALGLGCLLSAGLISSRNKPLASLGRIFAWGLILAALCDYIENIALISELFGKVASPYPEIAGICAIIKFSIILLSIVYILYGLVIRLLPKGAMVSAT